MKLIFLDEFKGGKKEPNLYGVCALFIDSTKYNKVCTDFLKSLKKHGWDFSEEFKGHYLFARNPGKTVKHIKTPEEMIELTRELVGWLSSDENTRANILYAFNFDGDTFKNFCKLSEKIIAKLPKATNAKQGKNLAVVYIDSTDAAITVDGKSQLNKCFDAGLSARGYKLIEGIVVAIDSSNNSPGIIYVDILAHLCKWLAKHPKPQECDLIDLIEHTDKQKANVVHEICTQLSRLKCIN